MADRARGWGAAASWAGRESEVAGRQYEYDTENASYATVEGKRGDAGSILEQSGERAPGLKGQRTGNDSKFQEFALCLQGHGSPSVTFAKIFDC